MSKINLIFYLLMLVISGFAIANTAIMTISRRTREIGMLMALGAWQSVMKIFLLENIILSRSAAHPRLSFRLPGSEVGQLVSDLRDPHMLECLRP